MSDELRELLEAYHCKDVVTQDLIDRIEAEFQRLQQDKSDLLELLVDARKEIELLRAIVDRLPKTADGVPVVPGMSLYAPNPLGNPDIAVRKNVSVFADQKTYDIWYSTCEAAEVARAKLTTGETGEG